MNPWQNNEIPSPLYVRGLFWVGSGWWGGGEYPALPWHQHEMVQTMYMMEEWNYMSTLLIKHGGYCSRIRPERETFEAMYVIEQLKLLFALPVRWWWCVPYLYPTLTAMKEFQPREFYMLCLLLGILPAFRVHWPSFFPNLFSTKNDIWHELWIRLFTDDFFELCLWLIWPSQLTGCSVSRNSHIWHP